MKRFITIAVMMTCLVACTFAQSIVGKWKATPGTQKVMDFGEEDGSTFDIFFTFNADKTYNILFDTKVEQEEGGIAYVVLTKADLPGSYTATTDIITLKPNKKKTTSSLDVSFPGLDKEEEKMFKKLMEPELKGLKEELAKLVTNAFGEEASGSYKISGNTLDFDGMKFTRVR